MPKENRPYWKMKIARNFERDAEHRASLEKLGWDILVVWECEIRDAEALTGKLTQFLDGTNERQ